jgi:hypothetical protein
MSNGKLRCGRKCQFIDQSNGTIKIYLNGRTGYRIDLGMAYYYKSSLEADFSRFLNYTGIRFWYEPKTFVTTNGAYTPDFYLPDFDIFFELKGVENTDSDFSKKMNRNLEHHDELALANVRIMVITQKDFCQFLKAVKLWDQIPNLEQRNYKKTKSLVVKRNEN